MGNLNKAKVQKGQCPSITPYRILNKNALIDVYEDNAIEQN